MKKYPWLVKAEWRAGHEIGNHTFSHIRLTRSSQPALEQELARTELDLDLLGNPRRDRLIRPPYSDFNQRLTSFAAHLHEHIVLWSIDSGDWRGLDSAVMVKNVLTRAEWLHHCFS